jgi:hypothetical protein
MIKGMVNFAVKYLNQIPSQDGISNIHSPETIVTGSSLLDFNHFSLEFGDYGTVFEDNLPTSTNSPRVVDAIALYQKEIYNAANIFFLLPLKRKSPVINIFAF